MNIEYNYTEETFKLENQNQLESVLNQIFADYQKSEIPDLNYIFCTDDYLLDINKKYLNHDYYTDVITFESSHPELPADIFISTERVQENADKFQTDFHLELYRVMIHGVLHLCGLKDKTEAEQKEMRQKEDYYLKLLK